MKESLLKMNVWHGKDLLREKIEWVEKRLDWLSLDQRVKNVVAMIFFKILMVFGYGKDITGACWNISWVVYLL